MQYITGFGNGIGRLQYRIGQKKKKEKNDSKIYFEAGALKYIFFLLQHECTKYSENSLKTISVK